MGTSRTRTSSDPEKVTVRSFKIKQGKLDRLAAIAEADERTVSQHVRWLIDRNIEASEQRQAAA